MSWDHAVTLPIVTASAVYLAWRAWQTFFATPKNGCGGCGSCSGKGPQLVTLGATPIVSSRPNSRGT